MGECVGGCVCVGVRVCVRIARIWQRVQGPRCICVWVGVGDCVCGCACLYSLALATTTLLTRELCRCTYFEVRRTRFASFLSPLWISFLCAHIILFIKAGLCVLFSLRNAQ